MNININIRAESADDYKAAIKALMDGAGMVGFDIPAEIPVKVTPVVQEPVKASQPKQEVPVEAPVPSDEEMPIEAPKPAQTPAGSGRSITLADVQAAGRKLALAGGQDKLGTILSKYGVRKLSDIPAERLAEAYNELEAANA